MSDLREECIESAARAMLKPVGARKKATAAFDAIMERLKEPDEATETAGFDAVDPTNPYRIDVANNVWQAMLQAATHPTKMPIPRGS